MTYRGRFAPSPTGHLHFGSLLAALASWLRARAAQGVWLVRIEDLDPPREVQGAATAIIDTLAAFGMVSDEPVVYQSQRSDLYSDALQSLANSGLAFPCWCSRADLAPAGLHNGACVQAPGSQRMPAWRLRSPDQEVVFDDLLQGPQRQNLRHSVGDFVLKRVEGFFAYQLAVVVDDAVQGMTEIVRGCDLLDSTARQIHLQGLLGFATPSYLHFPVVTDVNGAKLSKQSRAAPVDSDDPLPALRLALRILGYADRTVHAPGSVAELLAAAVRATVATPWPRLTSVALVEPTP